MAEFTKGPWEVVRAGVDEWVIDAPHERTIGRVYSLYSPETVEANARVMAAAPDLFTVCEKLLVYCKGAPAQGDKRMLFELYHEMEAAVRKAKGQGE